MIHNHEPNPQDGRYSSRYLSRKRVVLWDEPAYTVLTTPRDASLHPGAKDWEDDDVIANHDKLPVSAYREYKNFDSANDGAEWNDPSWTIRSGTITGQPWHPNKYGANEGGTTHMKPTLDALPKLPTNDKKLVSLFSGGGLMDLGFIHAGYDIVFANDFELAPCVAYRHNIGDHIVHGDITSAEIQAMIPHDVDGIIGGPPCQDFSVAGKGEGENGERGKLVWTYLDIIGRVKPRFFLFENVKGLVMKKHRPTFDALLAKFEEIGYRVSWRVLNAWDYGVAQKRERVFIVGIREDLDFTFEFPQSEFEATGYHPVLRDAIGDLPEPSEFNNHVESPLTQGVYDHAKNKRIGYHPKGEEPAFTIRTKGEEPAFTIRTKGEDVTEQPKPRRFTVRECLRIQSAPDIYVFPESMPAENDKKPKPFSLSAMYKVVGNGVPSRLAYRLAVAVNQQLDEHDR